MPPTTKPDPALSQRSTEEENKPQLQEPNTSQQNHPSDSVYTTYRYSSFGISSSRSAINFADNFHHNADLCEGLGLQVLTDTSIITSFLGLFSKVKEWLQKHSRRKEILEADLATINNGTSDAQLKNKKTQIESELATIQQKFWWIMSASLYFVAYLIRGACMLAVTLGAAAIFAVVGSFIAFGSSIIYAGLNLWNTLKAFGQVCNNPANDQSLFSLLFYDKKNERSYLAEICGCTTILLSGLITLNLMGILDFSSTAKIAFGAITMFFTTAYFGFWAYGKYTSKKNIKQLDQIAESVPENGLPVVAASSALTDAPRDEDPKVQQSSVEDPKDPEKQLLLPAYR